MGVYTPTGGYAGKILEVNLSTGKIEYQPLDERLVYDYVGGRGWTSRSLWDEVGPQTDPLGEEAILMMVNSPFAGTPIPMSGRLHVVAKSPLSGILGDSNVGGHFGAYLKFAGFDAIMLRGISSEPVWLWIDNGRAELRPAEHLWGKGVYEVDELLKQEAGDPYIKTAVIGPAGENLVRYSAIIIDKGAAAGRTGVGTVMGSKRLKAIAVRGNQDVRVVDPRRFFELVQEAHHLADGDPQTTDGRMHGTHRLVALFDGIGDLPAYNYRQGTFEGTPKIRAEALREGGYLKRGRACYACNYYCHRSSSVTNGKYAGTWVGGPEFENVKGFGSLCGNDDLEAILYFNQMANDYGLDTISLTHSLAFCMDAYDLKLLSKNELDGIDMTWGNTDAMEAMINQITFRRGIGDLLAEGVRRATAEIGRQSEDLVVHFKGVEDSSTDKRNDMLIGLWGLTSSRGADHLRACTSHFPNIPLDVAEQLFGTKQAINPRRPDGKGALIKFNEDRVTTFDAMGICKFWWWWSSRWENVNDRIRVSAEAYAALTGLEADPEWWAETGDRIYNVESAFNCREGIRKADDLHIPKKFRTPMESGPNEGKALTPEIVDTLMTDYYRARGWDEDGIPTRARLESLGLSDVADELEQVVEQADGRALA
jgi:aldehyde:ferredoxin oxidoreductase